MAGAAAIVTAREHVFFIAEEGKNRILLLITQLVSWMYCTLVPGGYRRWRDCCVFLPLLVDFILPCDG